MRKLFALIFVVVSLTLQAQDVKPQWVHFSRTDLRSKGDGKMLFFDPKGTPWVCLSDGLSTYQSGKWTHHTYTQKKDSGNVMCAALEKNGNILIGGFNMGIAKYTDTILPYLTINSGLASSDVLSITVDKNDAKWFGYWNNGISKYENNVFSHFSKVNDQVIGMVYKIVIDAQDNKWLAASTGLYKFDGLNWTRYTTTDGLANNWVRSVAIDDKGIIWAGTESALSRYDGKSWTSFTTSNGLSGNRVPDMKFDNKGSLWCVTDNGISMFNGSTWTTYKPTDLVSNNLHTITIDSRGNKWIAEEDGVYVFNENGVDLSETTATPRPKLSARIYFDKNHNNVYDAEESLIKNQKVLLRPDSIYTYTDKNGIFSYTLDSLKTYIIQVVPQLPYQKGDAALEISVTMGGTDKHLSDIGLWGKDSIGFQSVISTGIHRCGRVMPFYYTFRNTGSVVSNAGVTIAVDPRVSLSEAIPTADSIGTDNRLFWKNLSVAASEDMQIQLRLNVPAGTMDTMSYTALVSHNNATVSAENIKLGTRCSYDPNDIQVAPAGLTDAKYTLMNKNLLYTIRFQNTGNDTAYDIKIVDTLDTNLDWTSLVVQASSHKVRTEISKTGVATFYFDSIMLPHSAKDYIGSNGFVSYTIKHKVSIAENAVIKNTAHIIFDQNPAVITNTTSNTMVSKYPCSIYTLVSAKQITNCESVLFNGTNYTKSGTYTHILKAKSGCDSTVTLSVNILKKTSCTKDTVAFKKCVYAKHVFTVTTIFDSTLVNAFGCDSLLKLHIIITSLAGDKNGNGMIDGQEKAGDQNANGKIDVKELFGDVNGNCLFDAVEIAGDSNGDGIISGTELKGDANADGVVDAAEKQAYLPLTEQGNAIKQALQIHPNPVGNELQIVLPEGVSVSSAKIIDVRGQVLFTTVAANLGNEIKIDTKFLSAGIYTLQLLIHGEWIAVEIVKQ